MRNDYILDDSMISQEMVSNAYVFSSRMPTRIICNLYGTFTVTKERDLVHSATIVL
jgi:hypothetical protein